jgi:hypothetical protein
MKKHLALSLFSCAIAILSVNTSYGQKADVTYGLSSDFAEQMVNNQSSAGNSAYHQVPASAVSTKALRSFVSFFNDLPNATWYEINGNYLATFKQDQKEVKTLIAKNGYLLYVIRYGGEKDLPQPVRKLIKSNYLDFTIGRVLEVNMNNTIAWVVNLEDGNDLIIARSIEGQLDEIAHFKLQK